MLQKENIYKKKLHINHLLATNTLGLMKTNYNNSQNPERQFSRLDIQKELIDKCNQLGQKNKSLSKSQNPNKYANDSNKQNEHMRVIYKQVNSLGNLLSKHQQQQKNLRTPSKALINQMPKGFLLDPLSKKKKKNKFFDPKSKQLKLICDLPQQPKRYSSLNESCKNLSFRNLITKEKSATFRPEDNQLLNPEHQYLKQKRQFSIGNYYDYLPLISQESSAKSLTKVTSILNLKPKEDKRKDKKIKLTAMNKYDLGYENIRLASKILSMKPTKWCDLREQKKFYKKQSYFKEIRSRTIEMNDPIHLNDMSQSIAFPKINERYHTSVQ